MAVRIGFLGCGLIAGFHSKMLRASGGSVVRAGCYDADPARAAAFAAASGHHVCASEAEVLDGCDAVYVCTWTSEHRRLVALATERGLPVFCEKPLDTDLAGARALADDVVRSGVVNQVGLILRRSPVYLVARQLITDAAAGDVMTVVFRDDQFIPTQGHYASSWRADRALAGSGTLLEHSIHDVDMLRFLVGDIARVSASTANHHGHEGIEDVVSAQLRFTGGATGTLTSVWHDNLARPSLRRVEIFCRNRWIALDGHDWFGPVSWTDSDGTTGSLSASDLVAEATGIAEPLGGLNPDVAFVAAVAEGRPAFPDVTVALAAHEVVDAVYRSAAADGTPVAP